MEDTRKEMFRVGKLMMKYKEQLMNSPQTMMGGASSTQFPSQFHSPKNAQTHSPFKRPDI